MRRFAVFFLFWTIALAGVIPLSSWVYPTLTRLEVRGLISLPNVRPYTRLVVAAELGKLAARVAQGECALSPTDCFLFKRLEDEFGLELGGFPPARVGDRPLLHATYDELTFVLDPALLGQVEDSARSARSARYLVAGALEARLGIGRYVSVVDQARFVHFRGYDRSEFHGNPWEDKGVSEVDVSLLTFEQNRFRFDLGHTPLFWGPGREGGLIISGNAGSFDLAQATYQARPFRLTGLFAMLDATRFLSAHRIDLERKHFKVGLTETILFADSLAFAYLNPFDPFFLTQWNRFRDDNIMWAGDFTFFLPRARLYGELLIDDFQFEPTPAPNKYAFMLGAQLASPERWPDADLQLEYTQIRKWTYTQRIHQNRYVLANHIIGDGLGPDADRLVGELSWQLLPGLALRSRTDYLRRGIGTVDAPFEDEPDSLRIVNPPFPSGTVETQLRPQAGLVLDLNWRLHLEVLAGYQWIRNFKHEAGNDRAQPVWSVRVAVQF